MDISSKNIVSGNLYVRSTVASEMSLMENFKPHDCIVWFSPFGY